MGQQHFLLSWCIPCPQKGKDRHQHNQIWVHSYRLIIIQRILRRPYWTPYWIDMLSNGPTSFLLCSWCMPCPQKRKDRHQHHQIWIHSYRLMTIQSFLRRPSWTPFWIVMLSNGQHQFFFFFLGGVLMHSLPPKLWVRHQNHQILIGSYCLMTIHWLMTIQGCWRPSWTPSLKKQGVNFGKLLVC